MAGLEGGGRGNGEGGVGYRCRRLIGAELTQFPHAHTTKYSSSGMERVYVELYILQKFDNFSREVFFVSRNVVMI